MRSPKSKKFYSKVARSFLNPQFDMKRQWTSVNVKKNKNDGGLNVDLCIDPGALDTHLPLKLIDDLDLTMTEKVEVNVAGGGIVETHSFHAFVTLDGLRSDLIVLAGDTLLGIDVYSRFNSFWDWDRSPVVEMTQETVK